jgi:hypothetical protein
MVKWGVAYNVVSYARRVRQESVVVRMKEVSREELYTTAKYGCVCPLSRGSSNASPITTWGMRLEGGSNGLELGSD